MARWASSLLCAALLGAPVAAARAADDVAVGAAHGSPSALQVDGLLRLRIDPRSANARGPLAAADRLAPGAVALPADSAAIEAEWQARWSVFAASARLRQTQTRGQGGDTEGVLDELYAATDLGDWGLTAGKRVVGWDVGYGFRPNDVVQQELRRSLLPAQLEGRPLLQAERYTADTACTLVWVQPQHVFDGGDRRGADEQALAARGYWRDGGLDLHLYARWGEHTRGSLGASAAWVPDDASEWHGSLRWAQGVDVLTIDPAVGGSAAVVRADPWRTVTRHDVPQALLGWQWTGPQRQGLLLEAWYDGAAPSPADWRAWQQRNDGLAALAGRAPAAALGGQLGWQAGALERPNLHRTNLFARGSWEQGNWQLSADLLWMPADAGRVATLTLGWQGDRWRIDAGWRRYGGPASSVAAQLPSRQLGYVALGWRY